MITIDTIRAAAANDITAFAQVNDELSSRIDTVAWRAANRMASSAPTHYEEYAQIARIAAWECLSSFTGETVDHFFGHVVNTMTARVADVAQVERTRGAAGISTKALSHFAKAVHLCDGDVHAAEKLVQEMPYSNGKMSATTAHSVRLAWGGADHLEYTLTDGTTKADTIPGDDGRTTEYNVNRRSRPDMWQRAARALDDYLPAPKDAHLREAVCQAIGNAFRGIVLLSDVELLEDLPTPRNAEAARQVTAAVAILRGLVEQQDVDGAYLPDEMVSDRERENLARRETTERVHKVLNHMGKAQREALVGAFGIDLPTTPMPNFWLGTGEEYDRAGLAEAMGVSVRNAEVAKYDGKKNFRRRYESELAGKTMRKAAGAAI